MQLQNNFTTLCGIRKYIEVFKRPLFWSLSWLKLIQFTPPPNIPLSSILMLLILLRLGLPRGLPSGFITKILYALFTMRATCLVSFILHYLTIFLTYGEERMLRSSSLCNFLYLPTILSHLFSRYSSQHPVLQENYHFVYFNLYVLRHKIRRHKVLLYS
jgi:hypothetical protein